MLVLSNTVGYMIAAILAVAAIVIGVTLKRKSDRKKLQLKIAGCWGKEPEQNYSSSEKDSIASYFINVKDSLQGTHFIDDITWDDLDMFHVFAKLNATWSTPGEEYLYALLRIPVMENRTLTERERLMELFKNNPKVRRELQYILARLGKRRHLNITNYLYGDGHSLPLHTKKYKILAGILLLSPVAFAFSVPLGILAVIASFATNMTVYYTTKNEIASHINALGYIAALVGTAKKVCNLRMEEISEISSALSNAYKNAKAIHQKFSYALFYTNTTEGMAFLEFIKVAFLGELIAFQKLFKLIYRHKEDVKRIYETLGLLDSLLAVASYRESVAYSCVPVFEAPEDDSKVKRIHLSFSDIFHPLIKEPVANSASLDQSLLITGSNASGKSTFLKTVAINALLAQTIHTCLARMYHSCFFMIFTSMALKDSLKNSESYYVAEIKSLKRILDSLNGHYPCLCIVDEVLRGTNTVERISASSQLLFHLSESNCLCIAATHDIELTTILQKHFINAHFQEHFTENDIVFDYKLYPGKSNSRNAIKLLRYMGYAPSIVKSAEERALAFLESGSWSAM